jgi:Family of unknown function (DUF5691)
VTTVDDQPQRDDSPLPDGAGWDDWDELLSTATIGTDRRGGDERAAQALLDDAAVAVLRARAGVLPATAAAPTAAPATTGPECPRPAAQRLAGVLAEGGDLQLDLLAEWLGLACDAGVRVPAPLLPELLDAGRRRRDLRPQIVTAGGERARWLATQNPEWSYLDAVGATEPTRPVAAPDPAQWQEGGTGQRMGYLTALRHTDPAVAAELLRDEWAGIGPQERPALLGALSVGLGPDDEPFLEAALDDRRKEVRDTAAQLLRRIGNSAYNLRMAQRARQIVTVPVGGPVRVEPPAACDKTMRRDGVAPKPPAGVKVGERAWWVREILARTPLSIWPADLLDRPVADGWAADLHTGLAQAAREQDNPLWADRLLAVVDGNGLAELLYPALSPGRRVDAVTVLLAGSAEPYEVARLLGLCPTPWPAPLCAAVLDAIDRFSRGTTAYQVEALCRLAALHLPVEWAPAVERRFGQPTDAAYHAGQLRRFTETLRLRSQMHAEFAVKPTEEYA